MDTLLIDIGNSAIKWRLNAQQGTSLLDGFSLDLLPEADRVVVSCVRDGALLSGKTVEFVVSPTRFKGFISSYEQPETLGVDRFLAMLAGMEKYPDQTLLVIDAGSALTFDVIDDQGQHQGGLIMPGLKTLQQSFAKFATDEVQVFNKPLAKNTEQAWAGGTTQMFVSAINTQVGQYLSHYSELKILLTGGDAKWVSLRLAHPASIEQHLVLDGLQIYAQTPKD